MRLQINGRDHAAVGGEQALLTQLRSGTVAARQSPQELSRNSLSIQGFERVMVHVLVVGDGALGRDWATVLPIPR